MMNRGSPAWILIFGVGALFGIMCIVSAMAEWKLVPEGGQVKMAYHELISVLLTGIGVILATLALFIGALAVWGYAQFQSMTRMASAEHLEKLLKDGPLRKEVEEIIIKHVSAQLRAGSLREILEERVDRQLLTNAQERAGEDV
ncbi:hypothetical protein [Bradyrhizobium sp. USDA 336]|uniref:hypothetical protein n=1 Tax=Bradyrhizobium sp. USDA 336 TaxID=3156311 RepID=UPI003833C0FD